MRAFARAAALAGLCAALAAAARADQLAVNAPAVCDEAVKKLPPGSVVVSYCSLADEERVEVWLVRSARKEAWQDHTGAARPGQARVTLTVDRLFRSKNKFNEGDYREPVEYEPAPATEAGRTNSEEQIDLAYVYVAGADGSYRCLGKVLEQDCEVAVERVTLPKEVAAAAEEARKRFREEQEKKKEDAPPPAAEAAPEKR